MHWGKDFLVPYTDCHCDTCVAARATLKASERLEPLGSQYDGGKAMGPGDK
jgi:hypothetical protein